MDVKTVMFAALGLIVSGTATMVWVGNDMERIRTEERAELRADCSSAAKSITSGTPNATGTSPIDEGLAKRCLKIDVDLSALSAQSGAALDPAASAANAAAAAASAGGGTVAPTTAQPVTNPGIAPEPTHSRSDAQDDMDDASMPNPSSTASSQLDAPATNSMPLPAPKPAAATPTPTPAPVAQPAPVATQPAGPTAGRPSNKPVTSVALS